MRIKKCIRVVKRAAINTCYRITMYDLFDLSRGGQKIIFFFDDRRGHPGLVDRLKAIIGLYYIAKCNNLEFKLSNFTWLEKYLVPNKVNWKIQDAQRLRSMLNVKLLNYDPLAKVPTNLRGEYHVYNYSGKNILETNNIENWRKIWHESFVELFKLTAHTQSIIERQNLSENEYIAVHIRFVNALTLTEPHFPQRPLEGEERKELIRSCLNKLAEIQTSSNLPVCVFSDTKSFLEIAKEKDFIISEGDIGNISYNNSEEVMDKTFQDLLVMSRAKKIVRFRNKHLYESAYSKYAAIIGAKEYEIIEV